MDSPGSFTAPFQQPVSSLSRNVAAAKTGALQSRRGRRGGVLGLHHRAPGLQAVGVLRPGDVSRPPDGWIPRDGGVGRLGARSQGLQATTPVMFCEWQGANNGSSVKPHCFSASLKPSHYNSRVPIHQAQGSNKSLLMAGRLKLLSQPWKGDHSLYWVFVLCHLFASQLGSPTQDTSHVSWVPQKTRPNQSWRTSAKPKRSPGCPKATPATIPQPNELGPLKWAKKSAQKIHRAPAGGWGGAGRV